MIECIFTLDYEIYGDGQGSLKELVYEPAEKLLAVFEKAAAPFVNYVEAAEFEKIEERGTDSYIGKVTGQIQRMREQGVEIALHLHPQWYNAVYHQGQWQLDYSEYNLCVLPEARISQIVDRAITYLRQTLRDPGFSPVSFRAGNWLLQPTRRAAEVLGAHGIRTDSSVFKGGVQHKHHLDYRPALRNGYFWNFHDNAAMADPEGVLLEIPIYTKMVPFWKMATGKRMSLQKRSSASASKSRRKLDRIIDLLRFRYPLKLDFCRMTFDELVQMMETAIREDRHTPESFKPIVAIGHTKDLFDLQTIEAFLGWLGDRGIRVSTLEDAYTRCAPAATGALIAGAR